MLFRSIHNAFFWAIDRSQDATIMSDWFSKTGTGTGAEYRYNAGGTRQPGQTTFYRPHVDGIPDQPNTVWRKLDASGGQQQGRLKENLIDANLQSPLARYSLFGRAHMDLSDNIEAFMTASYSGSGSVSSTARARSLSRRWASSSIRYFQTMGRPVARRARAMLGFRHLATGLKPAGR